MSLTTIDFRRFPLNAGDRVLDLGCGEGRHAITAYVNADASVLALDSSADDLTTAAERADDFRRADGAARLDFVRGSGVSLPFADASFDKVICAEVLEHVPDFDAVLGEIRRVLAPGGLLAVSVPRFGPEWICWRLSRAYHEVEGGHVRIFRARQLARAVEGHDMRCYARHFAHALHAPYWWLKCLFWSRAEEPRIVRAYHRLLVWDLMRQPLVTRWLERLLDPLIGKSTVMYFVRGRP